VAASQATSRAASPTGRLRFTADRQTARPAGRTGSLRHDNSQDMTTAVRTASLMSRLTAAHVLGGIAKKETVRA
jgi:hypothetical protein